MSSYHVGSPTQRGLALVWEEALLPRIAFKALSCPCVTLLERCCRTWIACRWSNLMQLATWGSTVSGWRSCRHHRTSVDPIEGGSPLLPIERERGISPGMCENGK